MVAVVNIEYTPNPNALKFVLSEPAVMSGSRSFGSQGDADQHPLAKALFSNEHVRNVFFLENFVTVTKGDEGDWAKLRDEFRQTIEANFVPAADAPAAPTSSGNGGTATATATAQPAASSADPNTTFDLLDDAGRLERINELLDITVRPALAGDGGGIEVVGLEDGYTVRIRYQGACGSCPSSMAGTLMAIENLLKEDVDDRLMVVPDLAM